jgi:D-tyrosyl-tRNA(Tyr) deacylase
MKAFIQRVKGRTRIRSEAEGRSEEHSFEGPGLVVLLGWTKADEALANDELLKKEEWILSRVRGLRVFPDAQGKMNLSLTDHLAEGASGPGGILWVSQFTLAASLESGFRPSFIQAMSPEKARVRFDAACDRLRAASASYRQAFGIFGADMDLEFTNWGPVTIPLEI